MKNEICVIGGPSGVGKSVIALRVFTPEQKLKTTTSRIIRFGEIPGVDYDYVSKDKFVEMINNDCFVEYALFSSGYYGLTKAEYNAKTQQGDVYIILTEQGIKTYKEMFSNVVVFYIDADRDEVLKNLIDRGESESDIESRMRLFDKEAQSKKLADYVIVNRRGHLNETVQVFKDILKSRRTDTAF